MNNELNVPNPAMTGFNIGPILTGSQRAPFDFPFQRLDPGNIGAAKVAAENPWRKFLKQSPTKIQITRDGQGFDQRLPLPSPPLQIIVLEHRIKLGTDSAAGAIGAKPQINSIGRT